MNQDFHDWDEWRDAIEPDLSASVDSDLRADNAGPVRIVFDTELDAPMHFEVAGYAGELFAVGLQHITVKRYPAEKPGPTLVISTTSAERDFPLADLRFMFATATAVHELAHTLDQRSLRGYAPSLADTDIVRRVVMEGLAEAGDDDAVLHERFGIDHAKFVRRSIHLADRLIRRGWVVPLVYLQNWGEVSPWDAISALGDELEALADKSIRDVDHVPVPDGFRALFQKSQAAVA